MSIDIIIPLRNPTAVLSKTVESLITQADRGFGVLLSDNHSTNGIELIDAAIEMLKDAAISVRVIRPPSALGRVEHWNWAHFQSEADWLKPLFAGDWLEPGFISTLRIGITACPECRFFITRYTVHRHGQAPLSVSLSPFFGSNFRPAAEMRPYVLRYGMQFGPPSAVAYSRTAFIAAGGYCSSLPICADSLLFCTLASLFGVMPLAMPLCHFNIHDSRFSTTLPGRRRDSLRETITYYWMLAYHAWTDGVRFSKLSYARLLARDWRAYWLNR